MQTSSWRVDLTGQHSNTSRPLEALLEGRSGNRMGHTGAGGGAHGCDAEQARQPIGSRHRRHDWVLDAVIGALADLQEPMRVRDVHGAVEALLGEPVRWGSVRKCLSANLAGVSPRFVRVARGRYAASVATTEAGATPPPLRLRPLPHRLHHVE